MRKIIAILAAAVSVAAVAVAPASAKPGQYTQFSEDTAANGAHLYARSHGMGAPDLKTDVDCLATRSGTNHRSSLWLCSVDTFDSVLAPSGFGTVDKLHAHALVGVARKDGRYVLRQYKLVELAD